MQMRSAPKARKIIARVVAMLAFVPLFVFAPRLGRDIAGGGTVVLVLFFAVAIVFVFAVLIVIHRWEQPPSS
jgi:protein-S-isoprenylcysteine O-methyltransferase Ste14